MSAARLAALRTGPGPGADPRGSCRAAAGGAPARPGTCNDLLDSQRRFV